VGFKEALGAHLAACDRALRRAGDEPPVVAAAARPAAAVVPQPGDGADLDLAWWAATAPAMTGVFSTDRARLAGHLAVGGQALAALAPPRERSAGEKLVAETVHATSRALRAAFVRAHAVAIYDCATAAGPPADGLAGLVFAVADPFPGLVPDRATMAVEQARRQADKEGWEIDQAILVSGLLATADPGDRLLAALRRPTARALALRDGLAGADELTIGRVHLAVRGTAAHLTVANPDALNAEDTALTDDLETAVDLALLDPRVTVGVLRGAPMSHPRHRGRRVFSAGINLRHLAAGGISFVDFIMRRELGLLQKIARGLLGPDGQVVEKPWLAAVDSFAIGGGAQLLTVFDRVIAAADSYVSLPAAQEGIIPGAAQLRLGRSGYGRAARRAVLTGQRIWAREPDAALFFDEVVDPAAMDAAIEAGCRDLCGPAVVSNRRMLHLAAEPGDRFREYMSSFAREQSVRMYSADVIDKAHRFAPAADPGAQEGA
jgi:thioesterase DpgC